MNPGSDEPQPVRLGLVGLKFGRWLLRALTGIPGVTVTDLADRHADQKILAGIAAPPAARLHPDAEAMIREANIDAVILATSPLRRGPLLAACAARGLPVFVEKPWAGNPIQAREFAALCAPIAERVMVGFSFRFHEPVQRLRALLDGPLGPAWLANGEYAFHWNLGPDGWLWDPQGGGGVFNENSCHLFDVVCHLMGRPAWVQAAAANPRDMPGPELGAVVLGFPAGGIAAVTLGALGAPAFDRYPRLDLIAARGRASLIGRGHVWEALEWAELDDHARRRLDAPPEVLGFTRYTAALEHFVTCVRSGARPRASIEDGILAVDLAHALAASAQNGSRMELPPPGA